MTVFCGLFWRRQTRQFSRGPAIAPATKRTKEGFTKALMRYAHSSSTKNLINRVRGIKALE